MVLNQKTSLSLSDAGTSAEAEIFVSLRKRGELGQLSDHCNADGVARVSKTLNDSSSRSDPSAWMVASVTFVCFKTQLAQILHVRERVG
jgi:hypothetical protein